MIRKTIILGSFFVGFLLLITPCVNSIEHQNEKTSDIQKIDNTPFNKKMELRPHLLFYIAFGDFYVYGNIIKGDAKIVFMLSLIYFIFPQPHIEFNTRFGAYIITDFYDYYKIMYTNHTIIIIAIYR
jgi:hypothetical protein